MSLAILFHFLCAQHVSNINISISRISNIQRTENKTTNVVIQQHSRKLLMMDILMSETCWAHKKWIDIASDIKLVFYSSTMYCFIRRVTQLHASTMYILTPKEWDLSLTIQKGNCNCNYNFMYFMYFKLLTPNVNYSCRTAPLTSKVAFYIFIQQI